MSRSHPHANPRRPDTATLAQALSKGNPENVRALVDLGADLRYQRSDRYDALLDAVHGRDVVQDPRLIDLLQLLIAGGVALSGISRYGESGLRVLSRLGRFDAVRLLLDAGADEAQLEWTPLIKAVALGSVADVQAQLHSGAPLEARDRWSRTAWLVALQTGDIDKAALLLEHGADTEVTGRCGQPPLFYPIQCRRTAMLRWLLDLGCKVEQADEFGSTALILAVESGHAEGVDLLLQAGADIDREHHGGTALSAASSREMVTRLLEAGADPRYLSAEGRRSVTGLPAEADENLLEGVTEAQFRRSRTRRFGSRNPEAMDQPFWLGMIRAGITGYHAAQRFKVASPGDGPPVWCAQRFGQSISFLPDGRVVQIAGEHEDHYDPDFCIYNDVFVHERDGTVRVYGYPESVFPPTDFHTATLMGDAIYIIGSLGYVGQRELGRTPAYRLDTRSWRIDRVEADGHGPGWIHKHRAARMSDHEIRVCGGEVLTQENGEERLSINTSCFVLDVQHATWRHEAAS